MRRIFRASIALWGSNPAMVLAAMTDRELLEATDAYFSKLESDSPDAEWLQWYELAVEEAQRRRLGPPRGGFIGAGATAPQRSRLKRLRLHRRPAR